METLIGRQPESLDGLNAARYIHLCYRALNRSTESLFRYYQATTERFDTLEIASICRMMVPQVLVEERRFEDALRAYQTVVDAPANEAEGLLAQIGRLELQRALGGDLDNATDPREHYTEVGRLMKRLTETAMAKAEPPLPKQYSLLTPYPNPFNSRTVLRYALPTAGDVSLEVYDISGRLVESLFSGNVLAGYHTLIWDSQGNSSGTYIIRMTTPESVLSTKVLLVK